MGLAPGSRSEAPTKYPARVCLDPCTGHVEFHPPRDHTRRRASYHNHNHYDHPGSTHE